MRAGGSAGRHAARQPTTVQFVIRTHSARPFSRSWRNVRASDLGSPASGSAQG